MLNRAKREQRCTVERAGGEGNVFRAAVEVKEGRSGWRLRDTWMIRGPADFERQARVKGGGNPWVEFLTCVMDCEEKTLFVAVQYSKEPWRIG